MTARNPDELSGGHWEKRGMTKVWVPDPTDDEYTEMLLGVLKRIARVTLLGRVSGTSCPDCGCLLRVPEELCPACAIAWCREQEVRASWRPIHRTAQKEAAA